MTPCTNSHTSNSDNSANNDDIIVFGKPLYGSNLQCSLTDRNLIQASIYGLPCLAMVDMGATFSLIGEQFLDTLPLPHINDGQASTTVIRDCQGNQLPLVGYITVVLNIDGVDFPVRCHVVSSLHGADLILGLDFIVKYKVSLHYDACELTLDDPKASVALLTKAEVDFCYDVLLSHDIALEPNSLTMVECHVSRENFNQIWERKAQGVLPHNPHHDTVDSLAINIEQYPSMHVTDKVVVQPGIASLQSPGTCMCFLVNPTASTVWLKEFKPVAKALLFDYADVDQVVQTNDERLQSFMHSTSNLDLTPPFLYGHWL